MRKNIMKVWDLPSTGVTASLVIISIIFLIGGLAGCSLVGQTNGEGEATLSRYLDGFINIVSSDEMVKPKFLFILWKAIRWPLLILFLGLTPIGLIGIPVLILIRSFLLSFSIASFYQVSGTEGLFFSFILFGITGLIYIPILFVLGIQSFLRAGTIIGRIAGENRRTTVLKRSETIRLGVCIIALFILSFIEYLTGPAVLDAAVEILIH